MLEAKEKIKLGSVVCRGCKARKDYLKNSVKRTLKISSKPEKEQHGRWKRTLHIGKSMCKGLE